MWDLTALLLCASMMSAATFTVGNGTQDFPTIKQAIEAASSGDTIDVYQGVYSETGTIVLKTGITLKSHDQGSDGYNDYL
jgi:hypothetical protein